MDRFTFMRRQGAKLALLMCVLLTSPALLWSQAPVKMKRCQGMIDFSTTPAMVALEGTASHLGLFAARGEVTFRPGEELGTTVGSGPIVFRAANGDHLVGNMTWAVSAAAGDTRTANIHFRWSESVTFHDGSIARNTGRFVTDRPPGLEIDTKVVQQHNLLVALISILFRR
jgi:hypothetical protein